MKLFILFVILLFWGTAAAKEDTPLVRAVLSDDYDTFKKLLIDGENPNSLVSSASSHWLMCSVARSMDIRFIKLAVRYGGDINLRHPTAGYANSLPISCAVTGRNINVINYLINNAVVTDTYVCSKCENNSYKSHLLEFAVLSGSLDSAIKLYTDVKFSDDALAAMIMALQSNPFIAKSQVKYRDELIKLLEADGYTINLRERKKK